MENRARLAAYADPCGTSRSFVGTNPKAGKKLFTESPTNKSSIIHNLFVKQVETPVENPRVRFVADRTVDGGEERMSTDTNTAMVNFLIAAAEDNKAVVYPVGTLHMSGGGMAMMGGQTLGQILGAKGWDFELV